MEGQRTGADSRRRRRQPRGIAINGAVLRLARKEAGLTLADVAGEAMSRQALHQFETGKAQPTLPKLRLILDRLGLSLDAVRPDGGADHESRMANLDDRQQHEQLHRLAGTILRDRSASPHTKAVAHFYAGRALLYTAPRRALHHARTAYKQSRLIAEPALAAEALDCEAAALYLMQDPGALHVARMALAEYQTLDDREPRVEARLLSHTGTYLLQRGQYMEAIGSYREALDVVGSQPDLGRLAQIYHGLGVAYMQLGRTREALDYIDRAVQLCRAEHDVKGAIGARLARLENDYGVHLMRLGHWERADEMIRTSLDRYAEIGVDAGRTHSLLSMGELARLRGKLDEAIDWTSQAIELAQRRSEIVVLASGYQQLGELYGDKGEHDRFEANFRRAIEMFEQAGLHERRAESMHRYERMRDPARQCEG